MTLCQKLEAAVGRCSVKKVVLEISQNSQENTCARVSFSKKRKKRLKKKETLTQVFSCEFYEISKKTFFYRTPPVAAFQKLFIPSWSLMNTTRKINIKC